MNSDPSARIRALLQAHTPADAREADSLRRILALLAALDPFSAQIYDPGHLTASAVVLDKVARASRPCSVVGAPTGETPVPPPAVLLIFHTKLQMWLQPGGHFEPGEDDPSVAAAREVFEETGVRTRFPDGTPVLLDVDVHLIPARREYPAHFHFDLRMLVIAEPGKIHAAEVREARWFQSTELPTLNLDPGLQRALRKVALL